MKSIIPLTKSLLLVASCAAFCPTLLAKATKTPPTVKFSVGQHIVGLPLLVHYEVINSNDRPMVVELAHDGIGWVNYQLDANPPKSGGDKMPQIGEGLMIDGPLPSGIRRIGDHGKFEGVFEVSAPLAGSIPAGEHSLGISVRVAYRLVSTESGAIFLSSSDLYIDEQSALTFETNTPTPDSLKKEAEALTARILSYKDEEEWLLLKELFAIPTSIASASWRKVLLNDRFYTPGLYFGAKYLSAKSDAQSKQLLKETVMKVRAKHDATLPHFEQLLGTPSPRIINP